MQGLLPAARRCPMPFIPEVSFLVPAPRMSRDPIKGTLRRTAFLMALAVGWLAGCGGGRSGPAAPKHDVEILFRRMQAVWNHVFTSEGAGEYRMARLALYQGQKETRCGRFSAGPGYCPEERLVAVEQGWAEAGKKDEAMLVYGLARTLARHVQHELGIEERVAKAIRDDARLKEDLLRKREWQTECLVGLWRRYSEEKSPELESLKQAALRWTAVGGQEPLLAAGEDRTAWMQRGFEGGELAACNVFATAKGEPGRP